MLILFAARIILRFVIIESRNSRGEFDGLAFVKSYSYILGKSGSENGVESPRARRSRPKDGKIDIEIERQSRGFVV